MQSIDAYIVVAQHGLNIDPPDIYSARSALQKDAYKRAPRKETRALSPLFIYVCYIELAMPNFTMLCNNMAVRAELRCTYTRM